jgi:hypothetical protein
LDRARFVQKRDQAAAYERVVAEAIVASDVGLPERSEPRRLGPEAKNVMVVVGEDDPATGANCVSHRADDFERVGYVLKQVAGMDDVKGTPFFSAKRKVQGITGSEVDRVDLAGGRSLPSCFFELVAVALDPNDSTSRTG